MWRLQVRVWYIFTEKYHFMQMYFAGKCKIFYFITFKYPLPDRRVCSCLEVERILGTIDNLLKTTFLSSVITFNTLLYNHKSSSRHEQILKIRFMVENLHCLQSNVFKKNLSFCLNLIYFQLLSIIEHSKW